VEFDGEREQRCKSSLTKQGCPKKESANNMVVVLLSLLKEIKELASTYGHPKQLVL